MSAYTETLAWLFGLAASKGIELGLGRMERALALLGDPQLGYPAVHIAGTNGKGSTAATIEAVLRAAGYRTGLYTSPHLVDFTERIRVAGERIPPAAVVSLTAELRARARREGVDLTFFEFVTAIGLAWFARAGVEVAVVEAGLGGRLDATNVVRPLVTVVTSVARDHEQYLGAHLPAIAAEKAGIIKPGAPAVLGRVSDDLVPTFARAASEAGVPLRRLGVDFALVPDGGGGLRFAAGAGAVERRGLELALRGAFQQDNAALGLEAVRLAGDRFPVGDGALRRGLAAVRWPGRLEVVCAEPLVILDGAHNPAAVDAMLGELPALVGGRRLRLVLAIMADKDWRAMLARLAPVAAEVVCTCAGGRRCLDPECLAAALPASLPRRVVPDTGRALREELAGVGPGDALLVTGSLFLVGAVHALLLEARGGGALFPPGEAPEEDGRAAEPRGSPRLASASPPGG